MITSQMLQFHGLQLAVRSGHHPFAVFDSRIDAGDLEVNDTQQLRALVKHQALMRAYQNRYMLLPSSMGAAEEGDGGRKILDQLERHYDPRTMHELDGLRIDLEEDLIDQLLDDASARMCGVDANDYVAELLPAIRATPPSAFLQFLAESPNREHYYRHFLTQSSADLLAEASASALGVIGEFGEPQSALFRILIDEFGYGEHSKKHSVLFRNTLRGFSLNTEYNAYWPLFDTPTLALHNIIHFMFQTPRNFFKQVGFLLYAETSYQHSTGEHFRHLKQFHPGVDGTYFGEHAHIDIHHTAMVVDEVVKPLVAKYGPEAGHDILTGAELTRAAFAASDAHMLKLCQSFEAAAADGVAQFGLAEGDLVEGHCVTPKIAEKQNLGTIQVGGIGQLSDAARFAEFPTGAIGRTLT